jgi:hypothetical protein
MTFGCWSRSQAQSILWEGRWWLPPSLDHGESCEFVVACDSSMHQRCSNYALTNLLFGLCRSVWVIGCFQYSLSPSRSSSTPLYPWNVTNQGACPNFFSFHCLHLRTPSWVHQGAWGCVTTIGNISWILEYNIFHCGIYLNKICNSSTFGSLQSLWLAPIVGN